MIRHILMFQLKADSKKEAVEAVKNAFLNIDQKISGVSNIEWGELDPYVTRNKHYTHCVQMTFADASVREYYDPHPEHQALKDIFLPIIEDLVVFDYLLTA